VLNLSSFAGCGGKHNKDSRRRARFLGPLSKKRTRWKESVLFTMPISGCYPVIRTKTESRATDLMVEKRNQGNPLHTRLPSPCATPFSARPRPFTKLWLEGQGPAESRSRTQTPSLLRTIETSWQERRYVVVVSLRAWLARKVLETLTDSSMLGLMQPARRILLISNWLRL
jgi:hypothetical protein